MNSRGLVIDWLIVGGDQWPYYLPLRDWHIEFLEYLYLNRSVCVCDNASRPFSNCSCEAVARKCNMADFIAETKQRFVLLCCIVTGWQIFEGSQSQSRWTHISTCDAGCAFLCFFYVDWLPMWTGSSFACEMIWSRARPVFTDDLKIILQQFLGLWQVTISWQLVNSQNICDSLKTKSYGHLLDLRWKMKDNCSCHK